MKHQVNNFDRVAPYYDALARMVYGKSIQQAQTEFLNLIPNRSTILILGGGTGWILDHLTHPNQRHTIYFIEPSNEMMMRARRKKGAGIVFIEGTEQSIPSGLVFDVVITNFYFDLFTNVGARQRIKHIATFCNDGACWLVADFVNTQWWHALLLKCMYAFFSITSSIMANQLPDWKAALAEVGYYCVKQRGFFREFIQSYVLVKKKMLK